MTSGPGCPRCRAEVQTDWDWCHDCGFDPDGLRPAEWTNPKAALPYVTAPATTDPWAAAPTERAKRSGVLPSILIVVGGLTVLAVAAFFLLGPRLYQRVVSTKAGAGAHDPVAYTSPDSLFSASLSGAPRSEDKVMNDGVTVHGWGWDGGANGQLVFWFPLPPAYQPSMESGVLRAFVDSAVTGHGTSTATTFAGHAAISFEGTFSGLDGTGVVFVDNGRMWVLLAGGPWAGKDPQAHAFMSSFALAGT